MIQQDILQQFPDLFGNKKVNGRDVNVEETIATLTRELRPDIAAVLTARRELLAVSRAGAPEVRLAEVGRHTSTIPLPASRGRSARSCRA